MDASVNRRSAAKRRQASAPPETGLRGRLRVPGDKSISHRVLILGAMAVGKTRIAGLLEADDIARTQRVLTQLGARIRRVESAEEGIVHEIDGVGVGGFHEPDDILDFGNSGTSARLMLGALATHPFTATATGDASLRSRPMGRIVEPLQRMGATFTARSGDRLPLCVRGAATPLPLSYACPQASAQVKSAALLAGLNAPGITEIIEPRPTRDHSERLLRAFGADIDIETRADGAQAIRLHGHPELEPCRLETPGDPSAAAFPIAAALMIPDSDIIVENVLDNPGRNGFLRAVAAMGGRIEEIKRQTTSAEPCVDWRIRGDNALKGIAVAAEDAPSMIDEYPILAMLAVAAKGETVMRGLAELRVKESDRLAAIVDGLRRCGVDCAVENDDLTIGGIGPGRRMQGGVEIDARGDHRIAMAFLTLGLIAERPIAVADISPIDTSFPDFIPLMRRLGAPFDAPPEAFDPNGAGSRRSHEHR